MKRRVQSSSGRPRSILVRSVNWLGDAVMTTPALARLRQAFPEAKITILTPLKLVDLWTQYPAVDSVLSFTPEETLWSVARRMRLRAFDAALILPNSPRSALEMFFARIPVRIGVRRPWRNWFLTHRVPPPQHAVPMRKRTVSEIQANLNQPSSVRPAPYPKEAHQLFHYLQLVASGFGIEAAPEAPRLSVDPAARERLRETLGLKTAGEANCVIGFNPGAEYGPAKRWPEESFVALGRVLQQERNASLVLFGGPGDRPLTRSIAKAMSSTRLVYNLAGETTLSELMAGLSLCDVLVTNDSGPMHVAAAVGTPVVALFGSTDPRLTAPGLPGDPRHRLLQHPVGCSPCFLRECPIDFRCLRGITPAMALAAVEDLLRSRGARSS